jgi:hypothetical protein
MLLEKGVLCEQFSVLQFLAQPRIFTPTSFNLTTPNNLLLCV